MIQAQQPAADVLVAFGITGDLARQMTFLSLYRLEARGLRDGEPFLLLEQSPVAPELGRLLPAETARYAAPVVAAGHRAWRRIRDVFSVA